MENNLIIHDEIEQRTDEWFALRLGKFSASNIHKICGERGIGQTGESYIDDIIAEILTGEHREINVYAMEWGRQYEPIAREFYELATGLKINEVGCITTPEYENCICSPDGINFAEKIGFEIKCPENPANHVKHLTMKTQADLKKEKKEYYWQIMFSMLISGFSQWKFISYHPNFTAKKDLRMIVIDIIRDERDIKFLQNRIEMATEMLNNNLNALL
jgi:putative phage-type endonuclease